MKLISLRRRLWLLRTQRRHSSKQHRDAGIAKQHLLKTGLARSLKSPVKIIRTPKDLLAEKEDYRLKIWEAIEKASEALASGHRIRFDFTRTFKAFPGGLLIFLAYVELLLDRYPYRISAVSSPGSLITQLLQHFGFATRLNMRCVGTKPRHESVVNWQFLTGTQADGPKITELLNTYKSVSNSEMPEGLYDVLAEALTNVRHHAYPASYETPESLRKWWLFSRYEAPTTEKRGNLYIAVYDIGVGIQDSLRHKLKTGEIVLDATDQFLNLMNLNNATGIERLLLKRAIEEERSSTGLSFRGNGLPEMKDFVMSTDTGRLYIISGRAQYTCIASDDHSEAFNCKTRFPGTLILWSIPLGALLKGA
jgi:hypothetical protein